MRFSGARGKSLAPGLEPIELRLAPSGATTTFSNGVTSPTSCLRCHDAPCMKLAPAEKRVPGLDGFPVDISEEACASSAISRLADYGVPMVDQTRCVLCGVCASRCPVGAIRLVPGTGAVIADAPNEAFVETADHPEGRMRDVRGKFERIVPTGGYLIESDSIAAEAMARVEAVAQLIGDHYPSALVQSLLAAAGIGAVLRRTGSHSLRMDLLLGGPGVERGVAEVEFGYTAILETPRKLLDDLAVLSARYGWPPRTVVVLSICDLLPNRRSDYWEVIRDVREVLDISIGTVTVMALMLSIWNHQRLTLGPANDFYVDRDSDSYKTAILEKLLGRKINFSIAQPYVEIAK